MAKIAWDYLMKAYQMGYFPMAEHHEDEKINWLAPEKRCLIPIENFHAPRSLLKFAKKCHWIVKVDFCTKLVIEECAKIHETRPVGWINDPIKEIFIYGASINMVHSVSVHDENTDECIGGLYGLAHGAVFNGESMFSRRKNASKIALLALMRLLKNQGFMICDAQFQNPHLDQFHPIFYNFDEYQAILAQALQKKCEFI